MYVVAIAWLYVTLLMALTEPNITAGILTFCLFGLAPLALLLWLTGTPTRRRRRRSVDETADEVLRQPDRGDAKPDQ